MGMWACRMSLTSPPPLPSATHTKNKISFASSTKPRVATVFLNLGTQTSVISGALRGPGARRALKARPIFTEASAKQCPLLRAERVGGHGGVGVGSEEQARSPAGSGLPKPAARDGTLAESWGLRASRHGGGRAAVGDVPSALPEPVSTAVAWTGAAKTGPPEPSSRGLERPDHRARSSEDWRRLRHARGGAAAGGGRSRKRKRRSERGVGPSRSRILGDGECGPGPATAAAAAAGGELVKRTCWVRVPELPVRSRPTLFLSPPRPASGRGPDLSPLTRRFSPGGAVTTDPNLWIPRCRNLSCL